VQQWIEYGQGKNMPPKKLFWADILNLLFGVAMMCFVDLNGCFPNLTLFESQIVWGVWFVAGLTLSSIIYSHKPFRVYSAAFGIAYCVIECMEALGARK
jgi:hypothetical protein